MPIEYKQNGRLTSTTLDDQLAKLIAGLSSPVVLMNEAGIVIQAPIEERLNVIIRLIEMGRFPVEELRR